MPGKYRAGTGRYVYWNLVVLDAIRAGGRWIEFETDCPVRIVKTINERESKRLRTLTTGRLQARVANEHEHNGTHRGDVFVRWVRHDTKE